MTRSRLMLAVGLLLAPLTGGRLSAQQHPTVATDIRASTVTREVLARRITLELDHVSLKEALVGIASRGGVRVQYSRELVDAEHAIVTLHATRMPLGVAVEQVLAGTRLRMKVVDQDVLIVPALDHGGEKFVGTITGTIRDAQTKQSLSGAKIALEGTNWRAETNGDGTYRIAGIPAGQYIVVIKRLGYTRASFPAIVRDDSVARIDAMLTSSATPLGQVVVTGTVIPTELKAIPNAITVITAKDIEQRGITQIQQLFRGDVPGLFAQNVGTGSLLDSVSMYSRGVTSILNGVVTPIKTYIDGVELANAGYLSQIDPQSIERIEILTGPQASTIYGSNAINGVMQIFTKRGVTARPQVTLSLLSGWVENNFSTARTPQHDDNGQVSGSEGHLSYLLGGSWRYMGPWTPAKQTTVTSGFGGIHGRFSRFDGDVSIRLGSTTNWQHGAATQPTVARMESGLYAPAASSGVTGPTIWGLLGQTYGLKLGYTPTSWWGHEGELGSDVSTTEQRRTSARYNSNVGDTVLLLSSTTNRKTSYRYTTTARIPLLRSSTLTLTGGGDGWNSISNTVSGTPTTLSGGTLTSSSWFITRNTGHDAGGFLQAQAAFLHAVFLTYGLRAEWNPNYGADAQPNLAPRAGIAVTRDFGMPVGTLTAKVRASYGRSTRPPGVGLKEASPQTAPSALAIYGPYLSLAANPDLGPETQQGGEGGLELYFGSRGSLVVTRYNQTVDNLISAAVVDSVRSLMQNPSGCTVSQNGYCYTGVYQNLNLGSVRNQGWELQGTLNAARLTTHGTYTWSKSRIIGITQRFRKSVIDGSTGLPYVTGSPMQFFPEHTWALSMTYASDRSSIGVTFNGISQLYTSRTEMYLTQISASVRLLSNRSRTDDIRSKVINRGYVTADLNTSYRLTHSIDGIAQILNVGDYYQNDVILTNAVIGRQMKGGVRIHW